jgi:hypothetical protein
LRCVGGIVFYSITVFCDNRFFGISYLDVFFCCEVAGGDRIDRINQVYKVVIDKKADNLKKNKALRSIVEKMVFDKSEDIFDIFFYYS